MGRESNREIIRDVQQTLQSLAKHGGIKRISIQSRIKAADPAEHDFLGVRAITGGIEDLMKMDELVRGLFAVKRRRNYVTNPWADQYRSIHIDTAWRGANVEIQIRTNSMDNWSKELIREKGDKYWRGSKFGKKKGFYQ